MAIWYLAIRRGAEPPAGLSTVDEHLAWMREQHTAGTVLASGPSTDHSLGLYLLHVASQEAAAELLAQDPIAQGEHVTFEIIEWDVHQLLGVGVFARG
jgi:uncharacterized protein YciI